MKMIFFLGVDRSGKNVTMHCVAKLQKYKNFYCPRSPICDIVYDHLYNRDVEKTETQRFKLILNLLNLNAYFIFLDVEHDVLFKRGIRTNETHLSTKKEYIAHVNMYKKVFEEVKNMYKEKSHRFIHIIVNKKTVEQISHEVIKHVY